MDAALEGLWRYARRQTGTPHRVFATWWVMYWSGWKMIGTRVTQEHLAMKTPGSTILAAPAELYAAAASAALLAALLPPFVARAIRLIDQLSSAFAVPGEGDFRCAVLMDT